MLPIRLKILIQPFTEYYNYTQSSTLFRRIFGGLLILVLKDPISLFFSLFCKKLKLWTVLIVTSWVKKIIFGFSFFTVINSRHRVNYIIPSNLICSLSSSLHFRVKRTKHISSLNQSYLYFWESNLSLIFIINILPFLPIRKVIQGQFECACIPYIWNILPNRTLNYQKKIFLLTNWLFIVVSGWFFK